MRPTRISTFVKSGYWIMERLKAQGSGPRAQALRLRHQAGASAPYGCSGWEYKHWRGDFYPITVARTRWFDHYAQIFDTVEINNTFYRLPEQTTFAAWAERAPAGFLYSVKASRFLTHMKKLKEPEEPLDRLFTRMTALGNHLGPVLYQLPPGWKLDRDRLEYFLQALPQGFRHVMEFRDPSWYPDDVLEMLERYSVALCLHDMRGSATGRQRVGPFVYARFHGASGIYSGSYPDARLRDWATWLDAQHRSGADIYVYFNNDVGGHAPRNALTLRSMMEELQMNSQQRFLLGMAAGVFGIFAGRRLARGSRRIDFAGRVVVITGASRGLGLVIARQLAAEGARLCLLARE